MARVEAEPCEGLGLREASESDARVKRSALTTAGQAIAAKPMKVQAEVVVAMAADGSDEDVASIARATENVSARLVTLR